MAGLNRHIPPPPTATDLQSKVSWNRPATMDHSVKAMTSPRVLARALNPHRFENDELEQLYQRYICKLQHSSVAAVVALFVLLTFLLANLGLVSLIVIIILATLRSVWCNSLTIFF